VRILSHTWGSFQRWAESCPATFAHKHALISAEWARLEGRDIEAMPLYEQAIRLAAERGFLQDQALASELAARFYRLRGLEKVADTYLDEARDCYVPLGAPGAKVAQLDKSHPPDPTTGIIGRKTHHRDVCRAVGSGHCHQDVGSRGRGDSPREVNRDADDNCGRACRGRPRPPDAPARRPIPDRWRKRGAVATASGSVFSERPVTPSELPVLVLEQVILTKSRVILDDARGENAFAEDEYIGRKQARSLLCLPLLKQAELIGVLYLENSLASHVFTPGRIAVLKLLASQAAIALENARLYGDVAEREAKIRRLVDANIIGIFISSRKGEIIEANDAFLKMMGYDREDIATGNMRLADLTPPEWRASAARALVGIDTTGAVQPYEEEYLRKDGSRVPVLIGSAAFDEQQDHGVCLRA